jgi:hypothetical protein
VTNVILKLELGEAFKEVGMPLDVWSLTFLDNVYDVSRMQLIKNASYPCSFTFKVSLEKNIPGVFQTSNWTGSVQAPSQEVLLDMMDRTWIKHRQHIARFATT